MKTILQSQFNITNLHPFLKIFQLNAGKPWQMTKKHLSTALTDVMEPLVRCKVTVVDKRW